MLSVRNLVKIYKPKKAEPVRALNNVSLEFGDTGLVFLLGKSGSGKSTLLNAIGGLDKFDEGEIIIKGKSSKDFSQSDFDSYRNTFIGFIFQEYNILEEFSVAKNLELAIELQGKKPNKEEVLKLLEQVDMLDYAKRKPNQLSGGQKQRVAIARALIKNPQIIMADEPTGALDSNTGKQVMETLKKLSKEKLVIIVSHDREFAETYGDRIIELKDGNIISDVTKKEIESKETSSGIKIIDSNIVYIKKGQKISDSEMQVIKKMLESKSETSDAFISFDEDANAKLKEGASINDDGNREKFLKTEKEDVKSKSYSGKDLKLIKSRLKFRDSFKMGASSLKHKKGKLFFTILLSSIAFALFGLVDTFASFKTTSSIVETINTVGYKTVSVSSIQKVKTHDYEQKINVNLTEKQLETLNDQEGFKFYPVVNYDYWLEPESGLEQKVQTEKVKEIYERRVSGVMELNSSVVNDLGLHFVDDGGRIPQTDKEMCITKHLYNCLNEHFKDITYEKVKSATFYGGYKVVGIIDDESDFSKYTQEVEGFEQMINYSEMESIWSYGFSNLVFMNKDGFKYQKENSSSYSTHWYYRADGYSLSSLNQINADRFEEKLEESISYQFNNGYLNSFGYANESEAIQAEKPKFYNEKVVWKTGYSGRNANVSGNNIIVSENKMRDWFGAFNREDYLAGECNELVLYWDYEMQTVFKKFNIVGVVPSSGVNFDFYHTIMSEETIGSTFGSYKFAISKTGSHAAIKNLANMFDELEGNTRFKFQNPATVILDNFGETIEQLAKYLIYVAIGFAVFSAILLSNFIATSISYKKREIGILRAIGARGVDVFKIFFYESLVISLINFVFATAFTVVACHFINASIINDLQFNITLLVFGIRQVILMLGVSFLVAMIASFLPVRKIAKKNPIDAINNR